MSLLRFTMEPQKILVLLYKFCESPGSTVGYKLCETLVQEGHNVLVTSTSTPKEREVEKEAAKWMTKSLKGSIQIVEPEAEELEEPSPEWIAKLHKTYFSQLTDRKDIKTIMGTLPGTSQTAVELKKILRCRLLLIATTKVPTDEKLKKEVRKLSSYADEVWSIGPDIYSHYDDIYRDFTLKVSHKKIMLKPQMEINPQSSHWDSNRQTSIEPKRLITVWSNAYPYFFKGKEKNAAGSDMKNYFSLTSALKIINKEMPILAWDIHGLKEKESVLEHIRGPRCESVNINSLPDVQFIQDLSWKGCLAFVAPDLQDESFNFLALTTMWLGIPTLVSKESSIGIFLLTLDTPLKFKPIVNLTGDSVTDRHVWANKINDELLSKESNPIFWAEELAEFLWRSDDTWNPDMSVLNKPMVQFTQQDDLDSTHRSSIKEEQASAKLATKSPFLSLQSGEPQVEFHVFLIFVFLKSEIVSM